MTSVTLTEGLLDSQKSAGASRLRECALQIPGKAGRQRMNWMHMCVIHRVICTMSPPSALMQLAWHSVYVQIWLHGHCHHLLDFEQLDTRDRCTADFEKFYVLG